MRDLKITAWYDKKRQLLYKNAVWVLENGDGHKGF